MFSRESDIIGGGQRSVVADLLTFLRLDSTLLILLLILMAAGLLILYSSSGQNTDVLVRQVIRLTLAFGVMLFFAQISPQVIRLFSPWVYIAGIIALLLVLLVGTEGKGAQRWLNLGFMRFQPSELLKLAVPMMVAWYFTNKPIPPRFKTILLSLLIIVLPMGMIIKQPDLGTALIVGGAGFVALFFSGVQWRYLVLGGGAALGGLPLAWNMLHGYQRQRVLTFMSPESDPLGAGYHIIQSKIAIGSGGAYGKGWLNGTQAQLDFLPERSTDFIFAVFSEEFGLFGAVLLLLLYLLIVMRGITIALSARDSYSRMLAASLSLTFFVYVLINVGMVTGLLPVVGVPLPLISYGGTSMVTLLAGMGILMSIRSDRRILAR